MSDIIRCHVEAFKREAFARTEIDKCKRRVGQKEIDCADGKDDSRGNAERRARQTDFNGERNGLNGHCS